LPLLNSKSAGIEIPALLRLSTNKAIGYNNTIDLIKSLLPLKYSAHLSTAQNPDMRNLI
jgi:hypothetical protein